MRKLTLSCMTLAAASMPLAADAEPVPNLVLTCSDASAIGKPQSGCSGTWTYEILTDQLLVLSESFTWARAGNLVAAAPVAVCTLPVEPGQYSSCRDQTGARKVAFITKDSVYRKRATLHVETNGVDSDACGSVASPCRSITQAILNARTDDWILVGPGRYGNLDHDVTVGEPGEEGRDAFFCQCLVSVYKRLAVLSVGGATVTIIDANTNSPLGTDLPTFKGVRIVADGATFGAPGHGFTITGSARASGIETGNVTGVRIAGNIVSGNATGLDLLGRGNLLSNNLATGNGGTGFNIAGSEQVAWRNTAIAQGGGFTVGGTDQTLVGNVSNGNYVGYTVISGAADVRHNSALGNTDAGILVFESARATVRRNNIYGNGAQTLNISAPILNCGVLNRSGNQIDATQNYWGSSGGGGADPADGVCDFPGQTIHQPFAERPFEVPGARGLDAEADWADVVRFLESNAEADIAAALVLE